MLIRLHKYLADRGVASRRKCEEYIRRGLVKVNGKTVMEMGVKIDPEKDTIETHPNLKLMNQKLVYFAFNKPVGYVTTVSGKEKPKITQLLAGIRERVFPIGRLDKLTCGLLLLTNDGRFAYKLIHPKFGKEKEYIVKVRGKLTPFAMKKMRESFFVRGKKTAPAIIIKQSPHLVRVILSEGRNRQIRRMCERARLYIESLKRIRIGQILLGDLQLGCYRPLTKREIEAIEKT